MTCTTNKQRSEFAGNGAGRLRSSCEPCERERMRAHRSSDHVRGDKLYNGIRSAKLILDEIAKCEVVCANCHRLRHGADYEESETP